MPRRIPGALGNTYLLSEHTSKCMRKKDIYRMELEDFILGLAGRGEALGLRALAALPENLSSIFSNLMGTHPYSGF